MGRPPPVRVAPRLGDRLCLRRRKSATTAGTPTDQARVCLAASPPYLSVALKQQVAREHSVSLVGPIRARSTRQSRKGTVFHREAFHIDWDATEVTCPQGKVSRRWSTPASLAPYVTVEFSPDDCRQRPVKAACTRTDARKVSFLPRDLYDIQSESRTEQQTQEWLSCYSLRAAIESTISAFRTAFNAPARPRRPLVQGALALAVHASCPLAAVRVPVWTCAVNTASSTGCWLSWACPRPGLPHEALPNLSRLRRSRGRPGPGWSGSRARCCVQMRG
ncbi:transposase [Streptomyces sp. NPDC001663]|uniref:transposase n=1 Tax=Streptomyces sp. NPDC001663 TaxID=3364597 RepID=UPI0036A725A2